jgi:hypothetical protein
LSKLYASNPSSGASSPSMVPLTPNPKAKRKSNAVAPTPRRTRDTKDNEDEQMALLSQSSPLPALPSSKSTGNLSTRNPQDTPLLSNDFYSISIPTLTSVCASSSESPAALACASDFTLVIDGAALTICLNEMPFLFSSLCAQVGSVVRNVYAFSKFELDWYSLQLFLRFVVVCRPLKRLTWFVWLADSVAAHWPSAMAPMISP